MTLFEMSDVLVDDIAQIRPISATFMGIPGHDHAWDDLSPAGMAAQAQVWEAWLSWLHARDPGEDRWQKLAHHVMLDWLTLELESLHHCDYEVDLNSIASPLQMFRMVFDSMDTSTEKGWENIALRLEGLPIAMEGYRKGLEKGLQAGRTVAQRQVRAGISEAQRYAGEGSFFRELAAKYGEGPLQSSAGFGLRKRQPGDVAGDGVGSG